MSILTTDENHVVLFEDTGDIPFQIPVFGSVELAEDFVKFCGEQRDEPMEKLPTFELQDLCDRWREERVDPETGFIRSGQ